MTLLCGACNTENRDAAKFCKGCGRKIAQAWPQAVQAVAAGAGEATLSLGAVATVQEAARSPAPVREAPAGLPEPTIPQPARIGNGRWIAGLAFGVAVLVLGAAWWGLQNRNNLQIAEPAVAPAATSDPASKPAPAAEVTAAPPLPVAPAAAPVVNSETVLLETTAPATSPVAETTQPAAAKPRKPAAKKQAPQAPAPVVEVATPAPPAPAPEPVRIPTPQEACAGRNFIARAQCLAEQCGRADMANNSQCEAVRRQQRIEEERRNPTNAG